MPKKASSPTSSRSNLLKKLIGIPGQLFHNQNFFYFLLSFGIDLINYETQNSSNESPHNKSKGHENHHISEIKLFDNQIGLYHMDFKNPIKKILECCRNSCYT